MTAFREEVYYGHGKVLLSGEYFVLSGAKALALPVKLGQSLKVKYQASYNPILIWKSFDRSQEKWFETKFEFWRFNFVDAEEVTKEMLLLQKILRQARKQNPHFLRDNLNVVVETFLEFPLEWGLGSSSTLVYNVAKWAYVSPFELLFQTLGGSGYDIACAQANGPIVYERTESGPSWSPTHFEPSFENNLYFVYLGKKKNSRDGINHFKDMMKLHEKKIYQELILKLSHITQGFINCESIDEFEFLIKAHEEIISDSLDLARAKEIHFKDYWGEVKSLGAWGGDFILATSQKSLLETINYFKKKGFNTVFEYNDLVYRARRPSHHVH